MPHPFVHVELQTSDVGSAKKFYTDLFHWNLQEEPGMDYTIIKVGEGTGGGMMKNPVPGTPSHWLPYVLVDDIAATLKKAKSLGAKICLEETKIGEHGSIAVFMDPTGASLALWKVGKKI